MGKIIKDRKNIKTLVLQVPINIAVTLVIGKDRVKHIADKYFGDELVMLGCGIAVEYVKDDKTHYIVGLESLKHKTTLVHEIVHVVKYIEERFGLDDGEYRAYMTEFLYQEFENWMKRK